MEIKKVLSIAGSDPSGGAGIQADLKTFTALGVYGCAAITCLTVQNTQKVYDSLFLPGDFVKAQIDAVLQDMDISIIKTGMLGSAEIASAVGELIDGYYVVCDPVMISKSGYPLLKEDAMLALEKEVVSRSTVLTPNLHELKRLSGKKQEDHSTSPEILAEEILCRFDNLLAVLVKGGHIQESEKTAKDILVLKENKTFKHLVFEHRRYQTKNTHGTGCTLSSAITAYLARGFELIEAVDGAIQYVTRLIEYSAEHSIGKGNGPLIHYLGE